MDFAILLEAAKAGDESATEEILRMFMPLLHKQSLVKQALDDDLFQELCCVILKCIEQFQIPEKRE